MFHLDLTAPIALHLYLLHSSFHLLIILLYAYPIVWPYRPPPVYKPCHVVSVTIPVLTPTFSSPNRSAASPEVSCEPSRTMPRDPARSQPRWARPREAPSHPNAPDASSEPSSSHVSYGYARPRPCTRRPRFRNVYPTD